MTLGGQRRNAYCAQHLQYRRKQIKDLGVQRSIYNLEGSLTYTTTNTPQLCFDKTNHAD